VQRPFNLPKLEVREAAALIAVAKGEANEAQQILAYNALLTKVADMYSLHYFPDSQRDTDFALGKAFVGQVLAGLLKDGTEPYRKLNETKGKQNG